MFLPGPVIGVVHLLPLPGSPGYDARLPAVLERAAADARAYEEGGAHAVIVENYGDAPFFKDELPAETVAALTRCVLRVRESVRLPLGVNALRNDAGAALAVAVAAEAAFIRVNVHAGLVATDQGLIEGRAAKTLRRRAALRSDVRIVADTHVKHGRTLHSTSVAGVARDLVGRGGADAVVVTGDATGSPTALADLAAVRAALPGCTLFAGSGVTEQTVRGILEIADGVIVGTALKRDGKTTSPVDVDRVRRFVAALG